MTAIVIGATPRDIEKHGRVGTGKRPVRGRGRDRGRFRDLSPHGLAAGKRVMPKCQGKESRD